MFLSIQLSFHPPHQVLPPPSLLGGSGYDGNQPQKLGNEEEHKEEEDEEEEQSVE